MNARVPFPAVPSRLRERWCSLELRRFGAAPSDLDVDFGDERHRVTSELLSRCAVSPGEAVTPGPEAFSELRLGARIEGLLRLAGLHGTEEVPQLLRCDECGAKVEFSLPLAPLADLQRAVGAMEEVQVGRPDGAHLRLRLPVAADLRSWAASSVDGDDTTIAESLRIDGAPVTRAELPAIDRALAAADPLLDFRAEFSCPECQALLSVPCDLEMLALGVLEREQARLLELVHRLARAYHWDEEVILRLPAWRQRFYLTRLQAEEGR